jgi:glycosyltransferase involved in cell wall biosynthesis
VRPMKILFISGVNGIGGSEIVLLRLLRRPCSFDPVILLPRGPLQMRLAEESHRVYLSRGLGQLLRSRNPFWPFVFLLRWLFSSFEIIRVCRKERPDIVHASHLAAAIYAALPARLLRIPIVWHIHDIVAPGTLAARVCRLLGKRVDRVVAVSQAVQESLVRIGVPVSKVTVVYNGIDCAEEFNPERVVPGTLRQKYSINSNALLIGIIGVLVHWKGTHVFLDAIARLRSKLSRPVHFFIIGDSWNEPNPYKQQLLDTSNATGISGLVSFTGRLSNIPEILADLDIVVHASIEPDPLPTVILEAMAMRKLIIASECGGVPEMLDHGVTGFLYSPGDVGALDVLLHHCIHDYETLTALRERARRTVERRFPEESHRAAFLEIYRELAALPVFPRRTALA